MFRGLTMLQSVRTVIVVVAAALLGVVACGDEAPPNDQLGVVRAADEGIGGNGPVSDASLTIILPFDVDPNNPVVPVNELVAVLCFTDGPAGTLTIEWDFGDGTTLVNGTFVDHTYIHSGVYVVTAVAVDREPYNGEIMGTASDSLTITVAGETNAPPIITPPPDVTLGTDAGVCAAATVALGTPLVTDDADRVVVDAERSDGEPLTAPYPAGVTAVTWTATDVGGLTASAIQLVTVNDTEPPVIVAPASIAVPNDAGLGTAAVAVGTATATDNCETVAVNGERSDGEALANPYPVGTTLVVWTATDAAGNSATAEQIVTVSDVEAPLLALPVSFSVNATIPGGATVVYDATASDNVPDAVVFCAPDSGSMFPIGATDVTCTATDAAGNTSSGSFTVTVLGAAEQIANLIEAVKGAAIPPRLRTPLVTFLERALGKPRRQMVACRVLDVFIAFVQARTGAQIPSEEADQLVADATRIQSVLGCI
jgi:flagellin-like hook-associated protein FlgL